MTIYGTRPEAIKVAPVIRAIRESSDFEGIEVVTGQHAEMLEQVNKLFKIQPDVNLNIMSQNQTLNEIISKVIQGADEVLNKCRPDAIIVQGDTSTVLAASLTAFNRKVPVMHLEAGLRSGDLMSPFPEEANRRLVSQIASLHLAPTRSAKANLLAEGVAECDITITGNTVIDAMNEALTVHGTLEDEALRKFMESSANPVLLTTHRRENLGPNMKNIGSAIRTLAVTHSDYGFVIPMHKNPKVREVLLPIVAGLSNVMVTEPLNYGDFTRVVANSRLILTDSGGVQEEAPSLGKPVLVLRENTERPEAVKAGTVKLIGTETRRIIDEVEHLLENPNAYDSMANATNPYGDGQAARRTIAALRNHFGLGERLPEFGEEA
ncbi:non-hydrolyzing UDP-N-acetylglucosamine 2-epimerase [Kocuria massiliensis]|uniref:non-hydrolyzing UDP-N-acetylglucosamine 2-epimerase n=1 Tax=Kocuria massiliensis TaxID=1926282 RepID=UPI0022B97975|nr:UDP-N-acetylglucosamine 2-epimerase (non-hydrolyzing) [Kocuria massiliensis]